MMIFSKYLLQKNLSPESHRLFVTRKFFERITYQDIYYDVKELSDWLEIDEISLKLWIKGIPKGYGYKTFKIRKRKFGYRVINSPNEKLKTVQKKVYHKLLKLINYSPQATAYVKNKSIVDNAAPHVNQEVVINIDLKDFFGHIKPNRVYHSWRSLGWGVEASTILRNICCYNGSLPQGAPTSPAISNLCNIRLDTKLELVARQCSGNYTRYADDLTFSFPNFDQKHKSIIKTINSVLYSEGYKIQKKKRIRVQRSHQKQTATGLIVNKKVNLPRKTRRKIRAMKHHYDNGTLPNKDYAKLRGYIGLLAMVDKSNINTFSKKTCSSRQKTSSTINKTEIKLEKKTSKNSKRYLFQPWFIGILGAVVTGVMSFGVVVYWFSSIVSLSVAGGLSLLIGTIFGIFIYIIFASKKHYWQASRLAFLFLLVGNSSFLSGKFGIDPKFNELHANLQLEWGQPLNTGLNIILLFLIILWTILDYKQNHEFK